MDHIKQAVDRARSDTGSVNIASRDLDVKPHARAVGNNAEVQLDLRFLEAHRLISFSGTDTRARAFDLVRTQLLRTMDSNGWQMVGVTSPTPGCGKTVTATNLALSISRLTERSVVLVDADMHKPKVCEYLGINSNAGILSALEGQMSFTHTIIEARFGRYSFRVLPGETCQTGAAEWMASQAMATMVDAIKREYRSSIIIFDLPPVLVGGDVISIAPLLDCLVMVVAVGETRISDVKEVVKLMPATPIVRTLVNKVTEQIPGYYGYGY